MSKNKRKKKLHRREVRAERNKNNVKKYKKDNSERRINESASTSQSTK